MSTAVFIVVAIGVQIFCYELSIFLNWLTIGRYQKRYPLRDFIPFYVVAQAMKWAIKGGK